MSVTIAPPNDVDLPRLLQVWRQSFGGSAADWNGFVELIGVGALSVARLDDRVVGGLAVYRVGQWWGGRRVGLAGIAGVAVAPEARDRGVARELMASALRSAREEGLALSALYASTERLYRSVGYEQAGSRYKYRVGMGWVTLRGEAQQVTAIDVDDARLEALYERRAQASAGHLDRGEVFWKRVRRTQGDQLVSAFLIGPEAAPEGYLIYVQTTPRAKVIGVRDLVALTPAAGRRAWTLLGANQTLGEAVEWAGPAIDPWASHLPMQRETVQEPERWLLRIVDVARALTERGYAPDAAGELHLELTDAVLPENAGRWTLTVEGGRGEARRGGDGALRCDVRGLAALYSGFLSPQELAGIGWLEGPSATLRLAGRLFAGPQPWIPDAF